MNFSSARVAVSGAAQAARVFHRAGAVNLGRPDRMLKRILATARWGPLAGAVSTGANHHPGRIALIDDSGQRTYEELHHRTNALARAWAERGIGEDDVIGVLCRDHIGLVEVILAAGKLGARSVFLNTGFAGPQLADVVRREGVSVLVHDQEFSGATDAVGEDLHRFFAFVDDPAALSAEHSDTAGLIDSTSGDDLAAPSQPGSLVLLTSGTTGRPKGAARKVRSPLLAVQLLDRIPIREADVVQVATPLFHGTGLALTGVALGLGCTIILQRRFDPARMLESMHERRSNVAVVVPTMLRRILDLDATTLARYDTSALRVILSAGSALPSDLGNRALEAFGETLYNMYASTEVAVATVATPQDWKAAPGTVGYCPHGCAVRLFDDSGEPVLEHGRTGRIFVSNGLRLESYTDGARKEVLDGMMSTGDVGHFDAGGRLFVDGRDDDMIVSGGENVFPGEVEDLLAAHPGIAEAAVTGVDDPEFGQRLCAYVVPRTGADLDAAQVQAYVKERLARHKVPREVVFLDELPRNPTGKLLRRALRRPE